ncbi:hypothetical protein [Burkholderia gladioli]|uniref:hypothetical protein n=1 Tax=Burkholderia gladioli TaxID=28095 RepID=UPI00163FD971|nr:hypothetical protein [Burkholderia gladioli]
MTNKELLELAAKAAGAEWSDYPDRTPNHWRIKHADGVWREWNPLTDDGDALRLAVKLQLTVANEHLSAGAAYCTRPKPGNGLDEDAFPEVRSGINESELIPEDYAATRRAITRAAAEIARTTDTGGKA